MKQWVSLILGMMLLAPIAQAAPWNKSPELEASIVKMKNIYATQGSTELRKAKMTQVDSLPFFILYHDKPDAPEYLQLKAFLWGVQISHMDSINEQMLTNVTPWFCPKGLLTGTSYRAKNSTEFIENILWQGLEQDLKANPDRFSLYDGFPAFGSVAGYITLGLKTAYPCYQNPRAMTQVY